MVEKIPETGPPENEKGSFALPPLIPGTLVARYKRFLADVELSDGRMVTAHCPNSGRMTACCTPGMPVYLSVSKNPKRRLPYTWEIILMPQSPVGVNTLLPNRLVARGISDGIITGFSGYDTIKPEPRLEGGSRLDILLEGPGKPACYVEVKNCTLVENGRAMFPDAPTTRGARHLRLLADLAGKGFRAVIFILVQREDAESFSPADSIDPQWGAEVRAAVASGVELLAWDVRISTERIRLNRPVPVVL